MLADGGSNGVWWSLLTIRWKLSHRLRWWWNVALTQCQISGKLPDFLHSLERENKAVLLSVDRDQAGRHVLLPQQSINHRWSSGNTLCAGTHLKQLDDILAVALHHSESGPQRLLQGPVGAHARTPPPSEQQHNFWVYKNTHQLKGNLETLNINKIPNANM